MTFSVDVPLNTSLADLDESLRALLLRELGRHGFDGVGVGFDAPTRDWAAKLSRPTVALFLYDIHEAETERIAEWDERSGPGGKRSERPPLVVDCSYSITAWTRAVEDEHRLLSQVLGVLCAYREIPRDALAGQLADPGLHPRPVRGRAGRSREGGSPEFWTALGGQYKASVDYTVTVAFPTGGVLRRGPEVRTQVVRTELLDLPATAESRFRAGGTVRDAAGDAVADAWVVLDSGAWAGSDSSGRFTFTDLPPGRHRCHARAPDGSEAAGDLVVPGPGADLVVGDRPG